MPTYDYTCTACGHSLEAFHAMSKTLRKCPECGRSKLQRGIGGGSGIVFKGSGFYETDYRSDSYKQGAESARKEVEGGSKAADSDKGGDSKSSPSKPESKKPG
ncbi:MAG: zinc ribbon domain-containing protein [Planctomycetota bacterium]|jgi:putative FmdB family regulatory protein|nr:zinc ribbon domain-containing protein [Planctomycetota bacterium]MDP6762611.1 zinc ribbon domain-containing protein [Planctomycetota bacterium]MDP6990614.1 zinc ribbon domain-containing protein [Planctomycetota bacterium]